MKFMIIAKKEILDVTRDKRTLFMMIAFPLLLMPLLIGTMMKITNSQAEKASEKELKIAFIGQQYAPELFNEFSNLDKMIILDQIPTDSLQSYIQSEYLDAAINIDPSYESNINNNSQAQINILYKGTDSFGIAKERIQVVLQKFEKSIIEIRMKKLNLKSDIAKAYDIKFNDVASQQERFGKLAGGWSPYIFILFGFMGAMYPALDLGSGEKERGTLETILSSPASRLDIVLGKFIVIMSAAFLTAFLALAGILIGIQQISVFPPVFLTLVNEIFTVKTIALIMTLVFPVSAFFSAALLGLSIYARSFKEAQSIVAPLNIAIIFPAVIGTLPGVQLDLITALIPILNVSLASKDIISGSINPLYMAEVYLSLFGFAALSLYWCVRSFNKESTIFRN